MTNAKTLYNIIYFISTCISNNTKIFFSNSNNMKMTFTVEIPIVSFIYSSLFSGIDENGDDGDFNTKTGSNVFVNCLSVVK